MNFYNVLFNKKYGRKRGDFFDQIFSAGEPTPPEPDYLYKWDFTKSLIDEKQGKIATLSGSATQGNDGVVISGNDGVLNFLGETVLDLSSGKTIEIEFTWDANSRGTTSGMFGVNDGSAVPLYWHNSYGYVAYYKNIGAQYGSIQQLVKHGDWADYRNSYAFQDNSIIKFVFNNDSYDIYKDDNLIARFEDVILTNCVGIVGKSKDLKNSAYAMTIKSIRIYENANS